MLLLQEIHTAPRRAQIKEWAKEIYTNHYTKVGGNGSTHYEVGCSFSIVTGFRTEFATLAPPSPCPDPMLRTFWASMRVLRRLAAAVADSPCAWELRLGRGVTFGRGVDEVVLVFAMEASVWTRELRRGVVRLVCEEEEEEEEECRGGVLAGREGETEVREDTSCEGVREVRGTRGGLGVVMGDGVKETGAAAMLWPRRGLPERD